MDKTIFFDLTEALLATSPRRVQYYGIARTVIEIGKEAVALDPNIRFVVFSFGERAFFEVSWDRSADGDIMFNFPQEVGQRWFRTNYGGSAFLSAGARVLNFFFGRKNRRSWKEHATSLSRIQISHGTLISAARPKLIVDMIKSLKKERATVAVVPLLHDFMPLHRRMTKRFRQFDKNFLYDNRFVIERSNLVIANSQFTLNELDYFAKTGMLPQARSAAVVPLVQHCPTGTEEPEIELPSAPYFLTVGLNLGRKNIETVFEALLVMKQQGQVLPTLVVAGALRKRLMRYIDRPSLRPIRDLIVLAPNPNQTDLVRLYTGAVALVIPSRMEGWGLPAGEALWCGTPAICSTAPVLREVCGDLGIYFDPDDPNALADKINKLMNDTDYREKLRARIAERKSQFRTWEAVAKDLISVARTGGERANYQTAIS